MKNVEAPLLEAAILLERYEEEPGHTRHVADLADQLFSGLKNWHGRNSKDKTLLRVAALLHDIGWSQSPTGQKHHKFSAQLILEYDWKSLSTDEVDVVAQTKPEPYSSSRARSAAGSAKPY